MILVRNIRLPLSAPEGEALAQALRRAKIPAQQAAQLGVAKLSVDARRGTPQLVYTVAVRLADPAAEAAYTDGADIVLQQPQPFRFAAGSRKMASRPVVCGFGPAGMFAALLLARQGFRPLVLERGPALADRIRAVAHFTATGELDPNANIQFGEGGAGTFSDGKLTTRIGDPLCGYVTETFLAHGAPAEIAWQQKPHVGTDLLRGVIASIRGEIESLGGEIRFSTALEGVEVRDGRVYAVQTAQGSIPCEVLILAIGHSARRSAWVSARNTCRRRSTGGCITPRPATRRCRRGNTSFPSMWARAASILSACVRAGAWWRRPAKRAAS